MAVIVVTRLVLRDAGKIMKTKHISIAVLVEKRVILKDTNK